MIPSDRPDDVAGSSSGSGKSTGPAPGGAVPDTRRGRRQARFIALDSRWRYAACSLLVIGAGVAAYSTSFDGVFLFDEDRRIVNDERIRDPWPPWKLLTRRRPVVDVSLAINYAIGELDVRGYHAFNLGVHVLAGLALFGVVRRTLMFPEFRDWIGSAGHWYALAVALLWVVHPLQTQAITYIIQRSEALMGLFFLLTLYCVIRGTESPRRRLWFSAAIAACGIGMGSKAVMVTAPVVILIYDRVFIAKSFRTALQRRWALYVGLAATWGVLIFCGVVRGVLSTTPRTAAHVGFAYKGVTPIDYLKSEAGVVVQYLRLALWPHPLCFDYYWLVAEGIWQVLLPGTLIVLLLAGTIWALARKPYLGFIGVWFFVILSPTSSIVPIKDLAFEHRMYLPLAAVVTLAVFTADFLLRTAYDSLSLTKPAGTIITATALGLVVIGLAYLTARRNTVYHSEFDMWSNIVKLRPANPRAHTNLAQAWEARGEINKAVQELSEALRIKPSFVTARSNLGTILFHQGKVDEGIEQYRIALEIDPNYRFGRTKLGEALAESGRVDEGIRELRTVLRQAPNDPHALYALGNALSTARSFEEAIEEYRAALRVAPSVAEVHYSLANALRDIGRREDAIAEYREALRLNPNLVSPRNNLGNVFLRAGRFEEAIREFRTVLRLNPSRSRTRYGLATALISVGRLEDAVVELHLILQANPRFESARHQLALALVELGRHQEAIDELREALRLQPGDSAVKRTLESLISQSSRGQNGSGG